MRRRSMLVAALLTIVTALIALVASQLLAPAPPLDQARSMLADDARFVSAARAAETVALASDLLVEAGQRCADSNGAEDPRCEARFEAAAYARVLVVTMLSCTAPERFDARRAARTYLDTVAASSKDAAAVDPPSPPQCR